MNQRFTWFVPGGTGSHVVMRTGGTRPDPNALAARLAALDAATRRFAAAARATNTVRAYRSDLANFEMWCRDHEPGSLPAEATTVALDLTAFVEAAAKPSTPQRRVSAISQTHQLAGLPRPTQDRAAPGRRWGDPPDPRHGPV